MAHIFKGIVHPQKTTVRAYGCVEQVISLWAAVGMILNLNQRRGQVGGAFRRQSHGMLAGQTRIPQMYKRKALSLCYAGQRFSSALFFRTGQEYAAVSFLITPFPEPS
ncbi:hypothetical protein SDC9_34249 [bioreactor metagenome]|uniref:Uncharacterized protein n=3 Tax=root TaxID=1 RepID=A0A098B9S0_DESHA|nr:hypothetical protein [Desulfitobacterium hafniense]EHL05235.1 hypothetical protein HMPREF0322_04164 [Desulfitobacterium hafniense DP7]MEA5025649.1 hypothetical protein [Desulfitobacterium hafniense]CDX05112.1 Hypothetical protein DPCES_5226 [Desulfitobacterium hafniense]